MKNRAYTKRPSTRRFSRLSPGKKPCNRIGGFYRKRQYALIIDGDLDTQRYVSFILEHAGYEPRCCGTLKQAAMLCELYTFDLIIAPLMDDTSVLKVFMSKHLRKGSRNQKSQVLVHTSLAKRLDPFYFADFEQVRAILPKPLAMDDLAPHLYNWELLVSA
jgi:DNA-binding response OmpR family regulator